MCLDVLYQDIQIVEIIIINIITLICVAFDCVFPNRFIILSLLVIGPHL